MTDKAPLILAVVTNANHAECGQTLSLSFTATNATNDMITTASLKITLPMGTFPPDLATGYDNVTVKCPPGWQMRRNGGAFTMTPVNTAAGQVGPKGLEFDIKNITVNDEPGTSTLQMVQTIGPDNQEYKSHADITKVWPTLAIYAFDAPPGAVVYGGSPLVSWEASLGSVIALSYNGKVIRHVQNDPSTPLPPVGSFQIQDPLYQLTPFNLTAEPGPGALGALPVSAQINVSIIPPSVTLDAPVTSSADGPPVAHPNWTSSSATDVTLQTTPGPAPHAVPTTGNSDVPFVVPTTLTLLATNPATVHPSDARTTIDVPAVEWVPVSDGPIPMDHQSYLVETHAGIALVDMGKDDAPGGLWISANGLDWSQVTTLPPLQFDAPLFTTTTQTETFLSATTSLRNGIILRSSDLVTWTEMPQPLENAALVASPILATADGKLRAYANNGAAFSLFEWTANGQGGWEPQGICNLPTALTFNLTAMAGKLWSISSISPGYPEPRVYWSTDGLAWTACPIPDAVNQQHCSLNAAVFGGKICTFVTPRHGAPEMPMALWRIDDTGGWIQDSPTPGQTMPFTGNLTSVAAWAGTLFTCGNINFSPRGGIWARTT
ncbi:hypothetical protein [uncultured Tateyamaria sp.]|uniref:hypothetical protein n=1 Tax=uncultured Tateyamaria sp. TaxID=455651 RepID=UPI0026323B2A|nr:hypothetical protein [uncultured Tateyamaria sp.]